MLLFYLVQRKHILGSLFFSAGELCVFECEVNAEPPAVITWLRDNKPLEDKLADRVTMSSKDNRTYKLELQHCRESDTGLYTARASNQVGSNTCSAHLVVEKCKYKSCFEFLSFLI